MKKRTELRINPAASVRFFGTLGEVSIQTPNADHTLSIASVNLILFAARQRGASTDALIQTVGIDPVVLTDLDGRIPIWQTQQLWREVVNGLD